MMQWEKIKGVHKLLVQILLIISRLLLRIMINSLYITEEELNKFLTRLVKFYWVHEMPILLIMIRV